MPEIIRAAFGKKIFELERRSEFLEKSWLVREADKVGAAMLTEGRRLN